MTFKSLFLAGIALTISFACYVDNAAAQADQRDNGKFNQQDKFRQLEEILPTPGDYRTASGAPGHRYWQQKVDYEISIELNDENQSLTGSEKISYTNNSPDKLKYLWLQLDGNIFRPNSAANRGQTAGPFGGEVLKSGRMPIESMQSLLAKEVFDGGFNISACTDVQSNAELKHTIVGTMMRVDLPTPLATGETFEFKIDWNYQINQSKFVRGRAGCEFFEDDGNYIYEVAQWFPRLCAYTDTTGWQHKQFLGRGEFTLELGDYVVRITTPDDHVVASTGVLLNPKEVLDESSEEAA